ncbi:MAG: hypothetical protein AAFX01_08060 [Cyanobacteria bacterium J06638_28]
MATQGMVLFEYPTVLTMQAVTLWNQLKFVGKVVVLSTLLAIALKSLAPRLSIPATNAVSLILVLSPAVIMGIWLAWQLWSSGNGHSTHP